MTIQDKRTALKPQAGFTLVELAIVMIIIGLLIGGVLKGQQLITNAQIAATVAQIKAIDAATTSFKDQYAALPGDMNGTVRLTNCPGAGACGLIQLATQGNGRIDGTVVGSITFGAAPQGEQLAYWAQLNSAGLLTGINPPAAIGVGAWNTYAPASKISGGGFDIGSNAGGALFPVQGAGIAADVGGGLYLALHGGAGLAMAATTADGFMKPNYAARIDTKIDDGQPGTGTVLASGMAATAAGGTGCATTAVPPAYNESAAGVACGLYIQFQN